MSGENLAGHSHPDPEPPAHRPRLVQVVDDGDRRDEPPDWRGRPFAETRWMLELMRLLVDPVFQGKGVARGDGRPVVLMPGLGGGDQTLSVLAAWLWRLGYRPQLCGFIANVDCSDRALDRVERRVRKVHNRYGRRVALIGHSRGGHYARALGSRRPDQISHAISLGADLRTMLGVSVPTRVAIAAVRKGLFLTHRARTPDCLTTECRCRFIRAYQDPFPQDHVRFTSVYSKGDGVVRWEGSAVAEADCVEVTGSHTGLVFNRSAYHAIAAALAKPELPAPAVGRNGPRAA
jgi:pimeloyl-ACP methyl ester carboxylesterase